MWSAPSGWRRCCCGGATPDRPADPVTVTVAGAADDRPSIQRVRSRAGARAVDVAVCVFLIVIGIGRLVHDGEVTATTVLLTAGLVIPLLARRRAPEAIFVTVGVVGLLQ